MTDRPRSLDDIADELARELQALDRGLHAGERTRVRIGNLLLAAQTAWRRETGSSRGFYAWAADRFKRTAENLKGCATDARYPQRGNPDNRKKRNRLNRLRELASIVKQEKGERGLQALKSAYLLLSAHDRREFRRWVVEISDRIEDPQKMPLGRPRRDLEIGALA